MSNSHESLPLGWEFEYPQEEFWLAEDTAEGASWEVANLNEEEINREHIGEDIGREALRYLAVFDFDRIGPKVFDSGVFDEEERANLEGVLKSKTLTENPNPLKFKSVADKIIKDPDYLHRHKAA